MRPIPLHNEFPLPEFGKSLLAGLEGSCGIYFPHLELGAVYNFGNLA